MSWILIPGAAVGDDNDEKIGFNVGFFNGTFKLETLRSAGRWMRPKLVPVFIGVAIGMLAFGVLRDRPQWFDKKPDVDLRITAPSQNAQDVPCHLAVHGIGKAPKGYTIVVYTQDKADPDANRFYENDALPEDSGSGWKADISLGHNDYGAGHYYTIGVAAIPSDLANYLQSTNKWANRGNTWWASWGETPGSVRSPVPPVDVRRSAKRGSC